MTFTDPYSYFSDDELDGYWPEPPVDWAEVESIEAQEAREEAENGRG